MAEENGSGFGRNMPFGWKLIDLCRLHALFGSTEKLVEVATHSREVNNQIISVKAECGAAAYLYKKAQIRINAQ